MALKPLDLLQWIEIDDQFADYLNLKTQLLEERPFEVFASLPGSEAAQQEVLQLLCSHLLHYYPTYYQQQGNYFQNLVIQQVWDMAAFVAQPLELAGRLVQEDLCIMAPGETGYVLTAASVCFPLRWRLRNKLGQSIAQIHQPVPKYDIVLQHPVDRFFERLKPDYPVYRLNWSIVETPELFLQSGHGLATVNQAITAENAGEKLWLRVERQTLRRLPISDHVLFTIRTYVDPLAQVVADPEIRQALIETIETVPPEMQIYKSLLPVRSALMGYLLAR
jgi:hypothetical protein